MTETNRSQEWCDRWCLEMAIHIWGIIQLVREMDAIKEGQEQESDQRQHPDGDGTRETTEAGGGDRSIQGREKEEAVKDKAEPVQGVLDLDFENGATVTFVPSMDKGKLHGAEFPVGLYVVCNRCDNSIGDCICY